MLLWNDYEGKTIDGTYLLGPLLGPEGRSALFAVAEGTPEPSAIAITESLNDEEQMLACWTRIAAIEHESLIALRHYGKAEVESTPLTYVVMEASDATLADLLKERAATHEEALQIATSVTNALRAVHAAGLTHGHIVAENIVAVGETVKLRTDCIREYTDDSPVEREERIKKDVHDLSLLILRALTLERAFTPETRLAAPFRRIVANGINATWSLDQIADTLTPPAAKPEPIPEPIQYSLPEMEPVAAAPEPILHDDAIITRHVDRIETEIVPFTIDRRLYAVAASLVLVVILLSAHFLHHKPADTAKVEAPQAPVTTASVTPRAPVPAAEDHTSIASHMAAGWYVIAYTYNHEEQAWKKAETIMKQHPSLQPAVVSPGGHGPFLIAIGGPMTRNGAASVRTKAVRAGMPRDTFVRNYAGI